VSPKSLKILLYTKLHYIQKASVSPTDAQLGQSCGLSSEDRAPSFLRGFTPRSCEHLDWLFFFYESFFMNRENQAQETLHPLNDDIPKRIESQKSFSPG